MLSRTIIKAETTVIPSRGVQHMYFLFVRSILTIVIQCSSLQLFTLGYTVANDWSAILVKQVTAEAPIGCEEVLTLNRMKVET